MRFVDKAIWLEKDRILVISDLHLGFEEYLNKQGLFVPRTQYKKIGENLEKIINFVGKIKKIIILGDLKHEFGTVSSQEWGEVSKLIDFLGRKCRKK